MSFDVINAGNIRTQGLELDIFARPLPFLALMGGMSYVDGQFTEYPNAQCYRGQTIEQGCNMPGQPVINPNAGPLRIFTLSPIGSQDLAGKSLPNSAKIRANMTARAFLPLFNQSAIGSIATTLRYQSSMQYCIVHNPNCEQDAFTILDVNMGLTFLEGVGQVDLFIKNVFDTFHVVAIIETPTSFSRPGNVGGTSHVFARDASRVIGASARLRF